MKLKWTKYIPHSPYAKQAAFLSLPHEEAFYGGAAGGGKSDALLMGALQYVDVPNYSAIIFRRQLTDANLPGSALDRAREWLSPFVQNREVRWVKSDSMFVFPSGAKVAFGYLAEGGAHLRYKSAEFQYIGFDELTQFTEQQYTYLFSRMRRLAGAKVPRRMRGASNPGDVGHAWVRDRFDIRRDKETGRFYGNSKNRPFIPAFASDNIHLDMTYMSSLDNLSEVDRQQLKYGDWSAQHSARFKEDWFEGKWVIKNDWYICERPGKPTLRYQKHELQFFACIDTAASEATGVEGLQFKNNYQPSYTVIGIFARTPDHQLLCVHVWRSKCSIPDIIRTALDLNSDWRPDFWRVESNGPGEGVFQALVEKGLTVKEIRAIRDKVVNATTAQIRAENGQIWIPGHAPWVNDFLKEITVWMGDKKEVNDQVDVLASAANEVAEHAAGYEFDPQVIRGSQTAAPASPVASGGLW